MSIFRVPVDNQHFKDTVEDGIPLDKIFQFLSREEQLQISKIAKDGLVRCWGSKAGEANNRNFALIKEGDEILCYRSGQYIAQASICFKTVNEALARYLWGETKTGETWQLMYFFNHVSYFKIDSKVINTEFGFKNGPVMGFSVISSEVAAKFAARHGSVDSYLKKTGYQDKLEDKINEELSKVKINSPYEAQYYLVDLGNQLEFDTYVPNGDAGRSAFGKKLDELIL